MALKRQLFTSSSPFFLSPRSRLPKHLPPATLLAITLTGAAWQQAGPAAGAGAAPPVAAGTALAGWGQQIPTLQQLLADAASCSAGDRVPE